VVLDPAGAGEVLGELPVRVAERLAALVEPEGPHAGGPRVDGKHVAHADRHVTRPGARRRGGTPSAAGRANIAAWTPVGAPTTRTSRRVPPGSGGWRCSPPWPCWCRSVRPRPSGSCRATGRRAAHRVGVTSRSDEGGTT